MIQLSLKEAAVILGISPPKTAATFNGISIDTRTLQPQNLFIPIKGETMDGHDFLEAARENGAKKTGRLFLIKILSLVCA